MKTKERAGWIVASLAIGLIGCDSSPAPAEHPARAEVPASPTSVSTVAPPIEPSPVPSLPDTPAGDMGKTDPTRSDTPK